MEKSFAPVDANSVKAAFYEALEAASQTFLAHIDFELTDDASSGTGVGFPNILNVNFATPMVDMLRPSVASLKEAWLLVLAHESGHLRLNAICAARGLGARGANAQLAAMGIASGDKLASSASSFQKETAIEAYCDACFAQAARDHLGFRWRAPVEALRDHRASTSRNLGLFEPDEYATHPALTAFLDSDGNMKPTEAALVALKESVAKTSPFKKAAVSASEAISETRQHLTDRLAHWRHGRNMPEPKSGSEHGPKPP